VVECKRTYHIRDTIVETVRLVTNTHINPLGALHGGNALKWMVTAGSMSAMKVARGPALLAHIDNVFFLNPIRLGKNAVITSWIEYVGRSSMEGTILVEEEDPLTDTRRLTTAAHVTYVAVDENIRPRPVNACIKPANTVEEDLYHNAARRREERVKPSGFPELRPVREGLDMTSYKLVNPEDIVAYNAMHAGRLLYIVDELAGILAMRYAKGPAVTAAVDATDFISPILLADILEIYSAVTFVGRSTVEVGVRVRTINPYTGEEKTAATSFFTMVHISPETGRPAPVPRLEVESGWQEELLREGAERMARRKSLLEYFKQEVSKIKPPRV